MLIYSYDWTVESIVNLFNKEKIKHIETCNDFYHESKLLTQLKEGFAPHVLVLNEFKRKRYYEIIDGGEIINTLQLLYSKGQLNDETMNVPIRVLIGSNEDSEKMRNLL